MGVWKYIFATVSIITAIWGIPGMIEDASVWATWFAAWRWWNFVLVFGGLIGLAWSTSTLWMPIFRPATKKTETTDKSPSLWSRLNYKSARLDNWVYEMMYSDGMLNRLIGGMVFVLLGMIAILALFSPFILIALLVQYLTGL